MTVKTPQYNTKLFCEIYPDYASFSADYTDIYLEAFATPLTETKKIFYLLYSRYGNNPIANMDVNQFKFKMFSIMFQYAPTWEKRLSIQATLRSMSEADILSGSKVIDNSALNPSAEPTTGSEVELNYINQQNTNTVKKGKVEGYTMLWSMLRTDVTEQFLKEFQKCFKLVVRPEQPLLYISEEDE